MRTATRKPIAAPHFDVRRFCADVAGRAADAWFAEASRFALAGVNPPFYAYFKAGTDTERGDVRFFAEEGYGDSLPASALLALGWKVARADAFRGGDRAAAYRFIDAVIGGLPILGTF